MASALSFPNLKPSNPESLQYAHVDAAVTKVLVTFSGTYTTNGEAFDPAAAQNAIPSNAKIVHVMFGDSGSNVTGYQFQWDKTNKKIKAFVMTTGAELANGNGALAGTTLPVLCFHSRY